MPVLDVSQLNVVIAILGAFILLYGFIAVKIKTAWYLGEALPAVVIGIMLGPIAAKFIDAERFGAASPNQQDAITLGMCRIVIGVQLVIAGYQLPKRFAQLRWKELLILLIPVMTLMWLCTTACIVLTIPNLTFVAALVIGSCVTCTDPILSQAIAKGPFADKYVPRPLREIISAEAGANDGFGFPFLMLAVYLIRYANVPGAGSHNEGEAAASEAESALVELERRSEEEVGRLGGGIGLVFRDWILETWLYIVLMSVAYGMVVGFMSMFALKYALKKKWVDSESYVLYPTAMGLFIVGTCGALGTDDLLACFVAGNCLNWDGKYLEEVEARHDEVNSCVDVLLNFGGFMYIGTIIPWDQFNRPETGITYFRLFALGFLVLLLRRIPAIFAAYKFMPNVVKSWKEALFMGYFGPIGIGAVFYVEHTKHLFPELGEGDPEETSLVRNMVPTVYFLVLFSIVVHGLSIPLLNWVYTFTGVPPIQDDGVVMHRRSMAPLPINAEPVKGSRSRYTQYNRFSRPVFTQTELSSLGSVESDKVYLDPRRAPEFKGGNFV